MRMEMKSIKLCVRSRFLHISKNKKQGYSKFLTSVPVPNISRVLGESTGRFGMSSRLPN
jgi:hypothetical protein